MKYPISRFDIRTALPLELWQIPDTPKELFVQGSKESLQILQALPERGLAIVGTRNPLPRSIELVKKSIRDLSQSGLVILSGLARGIDTIVHQTALEVGLPTIAVVATGLDLDYPKENVGLKTDILRSNGLLVSEFPPGTPALSHHFLKRNRIIAGWSKATWVVEAAVRSGALNTARWARDQNRTCFAVPCFPGDPSLLGNQTLLDRDHALAFWGIHSFGSVWLDLCSTVQPTLGLERAQSPLEKKITDRVNFLTVQRGGAPISTLHEWSLSQGWDSASFFDALQSLIRKGRVKERFGALISL
jgi:DNA protecting protein DprA